MTPSSESNERHPLYCDDALRDELVAGMRASVVSCCPMCHGDRWKIRGLAWARAFRTTLFGFRTLVASCERCGFVAHFDVETLTAAADKARDTQVTPQEFQDRVRELLALRGFDLITLNIGRDQGALGWQVTVRHPVHGIFQPPFMPIDQPRTPRTLQKLVAWVQAEAVKSEEAEA